LTDAANGVGDSKHDCRVGVAHAFNGGGGTGNGGGGSVYFALRFRVTISEVCAIGRLARVDGCLGYYGE